LGNFHLGKYQKTAPFPSSVKIREKDKKKTPVQRRGGLNAKKKKIWGIFRGAAVITPGRSGNLSPCKQEGSPTEAIWGAVASCRQDHNPTLNEKVRP